MRARGRQGSWDRRTYRGTGRGARGAVRGASLADREGLGRRQRSLLRGRRRARVEGRPGTLASLPGGGLTRGPSGGALSGIYVTGEVGTAGFTSPGEVGTAGVGGGSSRTSPRLRLPRTGGPVDPSPDPVPVCRSPVLIRPFASDELLVPPEQRSRGHEERVGLQNVDTSHAAFRWYSWMSPPRTSRRWTFLPSIASQFKLGPGG